MPSAKVILFVLLGIITAVYCAAWIQELALRKKLRLPRCTRRQVLSVPEVRPQEFAVRNQEHAIVRV